jgi:hypothetical protein
MIKSIIKLLSGRSTAWQKVTVEVSALGLNGDPDFIALAWSIADAIWDATQAPLYFARYSQPGQMTHRIEFKVELNWSREKYAQLLGEEVWWSVASVEPCDGSVPHAQAYLLSRTLRGLGEPLMRDTVHWLYNMSGYNYAQEARMNCEEAIQMLGIIEKMEKANG